MLFKNAQEAAKAVQDDFIYWTTKLTETSMSFLLATIAANWAVFGNAQQILGNRYAVLSVVVAIISLALFLGLAFWLGELHKKRSDYAEDNEDEWEKEFSKLNNRGSSWPFTDRILSVARVFRRVRLILPLVSGGLFIVAVILAPTVSPAAPPQTTVIAPAPGAQ